MENGFNKQAKHGLRVKTKLKAYLVIEWPLCKTNLRGEKKEMLRQGENIKIVGVISSHSLFLSDQASWVKKIQKDLR